MCGVVCGALVGLLLLAGLYYLAFAVVVFAPVILLVVGLLALYAKSWVVAAICIGVAAVIMSLQDSKEGAQE